MLVLIPAQNLKYMEIDNWLPMHFPLEHVSGDEHSSFKPHLHFPAVHVSASPAQSSLVIHSEEDVSHAFYIMSNHDNDDVILNEE